MTTSIHLRTGACQRVNVAARRTPACKRGSGVRVLQHTNLAARSKASLIAPLRQHTRATFAAVQSTASQHETAEAERRASSQNASTSASPSQRAPARAKQLQYEVVEQPDQLIAMLEELRSVDCIALDCEGVKLGNRDGGKLSLMQISARVGGKAAAPGMHGLKIWVVDVTKLEWRALRYHTADKKVSLKKILEDGKVTKLMYDVRSDAAQLSKEHDVRMRAAYDLQLAEVAVRQLQQIPTTYVLPLPKALENYVPRTPAFEADMVMGNQIAATYHYANKTEIWEQRPLAEELLQYAANDVKYLHLLHEALNKKLPQQIVSKVKSESAARVQSPSVAAEQRASAPVIVKKSDLRQLFQVRPNSNNNSSSTSSTSSSSSSGSISAAAAGASADTAVAHEDGNREQEGPRKLPPRLSLLSTSDSQGASGGSAPYLLQPRKRLPGEQPPAWLYETPAPAKEPAAATEQGAPAEGAAAAEAGDVGSNGSEPPEAGSNGVHAEAAGNGTAAESTQEEPKPSTLLWKTTPVAAPSRSAPGLNKPLAKPVRRPGS